MHRSGTSAITRVLSLLGADLPSQLWPANDGNVTGYWESQELTQVLDDALASADRAWDHHGRIAPGWFDTSDAEKYREQVLQILRQHFSQSGLFVLKDPRISVLVPFFEAVLNQMGVEPVYVIAVRNPIEVASSLARRNKFLPQKSMLLWLRHTLESERATRGKRRCIVCYDAVLANWHQSADRIANQTGISWPRPVEQAAAEIDPFLADSLRHHRAGDQDIQDDPSIIWWVKDTYRAMKALAEDRAEGAEQTLDHAAAAFDQADLAYAPLISEHHIATWKAYHQGTALDETRAELERLGAERDDLRARLDSTTVAEQKQRERAEQMAAQLQQAEIDHRRLEEDWTAHRQRNRELLEEIRSMQRRQREMESLRAELQAARAQLETAISARDTAERDRDTTVTSFSTRELDRLLVSERAREIEQTLDRPVGLPFRMAMKLNRRLNPSDLVQIFFNEQYYREQTPDLPAETDALKHFMRLGWRQHRNPHPIFDVGFYLHCNPDVARSGVNPLLHFLHSGRRELRDPNRLFDMRYYLARNPDVLTAAVDPVQHYMLHGARENRDPGPLFDTSYYREFYPEYVELGVDPLSHYLWIGQREGKAPFGIDRLGMPVAD